jgi:hypothetical protein
MIESAESNVAVCDPSLPELILLVLFLNVSLATLARLIVLLI